MGNLASIINAFELIGADIRVEKEPEKLREYDKLIFTRCWGIWRCYGASKREGNG